MKRGISLSSKILLLALLNLLLLVSLFLAFARLQFRFDLGSFLFASARERVVSVSRLAAVELNQTSADEWTQLMHEFSARYPSKFYVFTTEGAQLAGDRVVLPPGFAQLLRHPMVIGRPPHEAGPPPPPPDQQPPPDQEPSPPPTGQRDAPGMRPFLRHHWFGANWPMHFMRTTNPTQYWIGVAIPVREPGTGDPMPAALVWRFPSLWTEPFFFDIRPWIAVIIAALLIPALCWIPLVRRITRAISRMTAATGQIANGHFDITLPQGRRDELGVLSDSINRMAKRLSGYVNGQRRFLGDIAHELASPIARMQIALGILEQRATEAEASYVADVNEELQHMSSLVNELLQFSRSTAATQQVTLRPIEISELLQRVVNREGMAESTIKLQVPHGLEVNADPECLFRAAANVVRNAIRYAGDAGPIEVSATRERDKVQIRVADSGPGIPEPELDNVFRPFYRPEFARSRETGGAGLGLAIVRDCIESCGGKVECRNRKPKGLEVIMVLPAALPVSV